MTSSPGFRPILHRRFFVFSSLFLSLAALLFLSGCVYLRLLEVKRQLREFDQNFELTGDPEMILRFKNPILLAKDARFLIGADPFSESGAGPDETLRHYEFVSVRSGAPQNAPMERLTLDLRVARGMLLEIITPHEFLQLFHRKIMEETMRQAAYANVSELKKTASASIRFSPKAEALLPDRAMTLGLLGFPLETDREEGMEVLVYRYKMIKKGEDAPIFGRFYFSPEGLLQRLSVRWDSATIIADFPRKR